MAMDAKSYRKGVSDSLLEDKKDYDGMFKPFDLPHNDDAENSYKNGRKEGDKLKKEFTAKGLGRSYRRGVSDSLLDPKDRDYDGRYKPFDLPSSDKNAYKEARAEGDKLRKDIEGRPQY